MGISHCQAWKQTLVRVYNSREFVVCAKLFCIKHWRKLEFDKFTGVGCERKRNKTTSFLKQTLPQTSNHLIQIQMKRNTLTALLALALFTWGTPNMQAQTEEQHLNHGVSYNLPRLVAQKGMENVYDAIGTLPGIVVQNGVYMLGGRAIAVSINGEP